jgi:hypothetical protein
MECGATPDQCGCGLEFWKGKDMSICRTDHISQSMKSLVTIFFILLGVFMVLKAVIGLCSGGIYYYTQVIPGWPKNRSDLCTRLEDGWFYYLVCFLYLAGGAGLIIYMALGF